VRLQIVYHQHRGPYEQAVQCETSKEVHTATLATATKLNKKISKLKGDKKEIIEVTYRLVQHSQIALSLLHQRFCPEWIWNGSIDSDP
jgi:hypothetical protein